MIVTKLDFENGFNTSIIDRLLNKSLNFTYFMV